MDAVNDLHRLSLSVPTLRAAHLNERRRRQARLGAAAILLAVGLAAVFAGCKESCEPRDDRDPCTIDACDNGVRVHTYLGDGHPCFLGRFQGTCSSGWCIVPCSKDADCDDGNPCTEDDCATGGACDFDDAGTAPPDGNVCTNDSCLGGDPWYWPVPGGSPCNDGKGECASGICSSCETSADCGANLPCREWDCQLGKCVSNDKPKGAPPNAVNFPGDCLMHICDGYGGVDSVANPYDAPMSTNPCLAWTCAGWTPVVDVESQKGHPCGTSIGAVGVCDGEGECVGCLDDGDCPNPAEDRCYNHVCVSCGDNTQNGDETDVDCGGTCGACLGESCMADAECASDECVFTNAVPEKVCCDAPCDGPCRQCNVSGACGYVPWGKPDIETCNSPAEACNGLGACKIKSGYSCVQNLDCLSNICNLVTHVCN